MLSTRFTMSISILFFISHLQYVKEKETAEDVTNETFMQFFAHKDQIKVPSKIKTYLARTSKNLSLNILEMHKREEPLVQDVETEEKMDDFMMYMQKFSSYLDQEEVDYIIWHLLYGFTFHEIAQEKQVSIHVVSSKYKRAVDKIRKHYEEK